MDADIITLARQRADLCRVFGSTRRVLIIWVLGQEEMSVSSIASAINASLQNTSQHLRLMKNKGILKSRRDGNTIYYHIVDNTLIHECPVLLQSQQFYHQQDYSNEQKNKEITND